MSGTVGQGGLLAEQEGGWSAAGGMRIAEDWLQAFPQMNIFACMNDDMAIGVIQALRAAGKSADLQNRNILVLGVDGSDAAKSYIRSGELAATAGRRLAVESMTALETAEKIIRGEVVDRLVIPNSFHAMNRENVDQ